MDKKLITFGCSFTEFSWPTWADWMGTTIDLSTIELSARREQARSSVQLATVQIDPAQIKALPATGGEADLAQYLTVLPGIVTTGDQGGQLYIRGGSPVQQAARMLAASFSPPPTMIGAEVCSLTCSMAANGTGCPAPEPASMYMTLRPSISPATAVAATMLGLLAGMGKEWLM